MMAVVELVVSEELGSGCPIVGKAIRLCLILIW